jgi:hypothetical protein
LPDPLVRVKRDVSTFVDSSRLTRTPLPQRIPEKSGGHHQQGARSLVSPLPAVNPQNSHNSVTTCAIPACSSEKDRFRAGTHDNAPLTLAIPRSVVHNHLCTLDLSARFSRNPLRFGTRHNGVDDIPIPRIKLGDPVNDVPDPRIIDVIDRITKCDSFDDILTPRTSLLDSANDNVNGLNDIHDPKIIPALLRIIPAAQRAAPAAVFQGRTLESKRPDESAGSAQTEELAD